jgi:hypothetical protein
VGLLALLALAVWFVPCCSMCVRGHSGWSSSRKPSPDGRWEVIHEHASGAFDSFNRLWIAERGASWWHWQLIAPTVDGVWWYEWLAPDHLLLTDYGEGHFGDGPPPLQMFHGLRIETRGPAAHQTFESPDGQHEVTIWTGQDSRGTRQHAWVHSTWRNQAKVFEHVLPAGKWSIDAVWLANDRVRFTIRTEQPDTTLPEVPDRIGGIAVELVRR